MKEKIKEEMQQKIHQEKELSLRRLMMLIDNNLKKFICLWALVACIPLVSALIFDSFVTGKSHPAEGAILQGVALFSLFSILVTVFFSLRMAFFRGTKGYTKLVIIGVAYFVLWLAFGNLFYLIADVEAYASCVLKTTGQQVQCFNGIKDFWLTTASAEAELVPDSINRLTNYIDCLYFSGISIVTMGFGDIVPVAGFCKILVLLETFSGQILTVAAAGLCFAGISGPEDLERKKNNNDNR